MKDLKINQEITADPVILIDETGKMLGNVSLDQARFLAFERNLDLGLINEKVQPPIAKLIDYGKYQYAQSKQLSKQRAKTKETEIKEIRLGIKIGEHDLSVKNNKIKDFIDRGDKVKVSIQLRGREMIFKDRVNDLVNKILQETGGALEKPIERMGSRFFVIITKGNQNEAKNN